MVPSVSPIEFRETHLYVPMSAGETERIVSFIVILYPVSSRTGSYLPSEKFKEYQPDYAIYGNTIYFYFIY